MQNFQVSNGVNVVCQLNNSVNKRVLFILPVVSQPRYSKRIQSYLDSGYQVTVASFKRKYFEKNTLPAGVDFISLGRIENGNYFIRIFKILPSLLRIFRLSRKHTFVYIFSVDVLLIILFQRNSKNIFFELGDIREVSKSEIIIRVFDFFYIRALDNCHRVIVTSKGFRNFLIDRYRVKSDKVFILENKLQRKVFTAEIRPQVSELNVNSICIGIIGFLRYDNVIELLKCFSQNTSYSLSIKIFGDGPLKSEILQYVDDDRVKYFGQFKYPEDLWQIYEQIDVSFTMYDSNSLNVRLALPNKLYESIYFRKPIIVSSNTYLGEIVNELGVGFSWDQDDIQSLLVYLNSKDYIIKYNSLLERIGQIHEPIYLA